MHYNRLVQLAGLLVTAVCLTGTSLLLPRINAERKTLELEAQDIPGQSVPPRVAMLTATLGSFRGLLVDYLWFRANELKEDGKFYEANTLSQLITDLQPRFPQVWAFHAWNMAYNISVATFTPEERWEWVNKGVNLLRDRGIPFNPRSVRLYRELSWIFFHKIGQYSDDMHWHYKRELAFDMQEFLGDLDRGGTTEEVLGRVKAIADAPDTLDELKTQSPSVLPVLAKLKELGYEPDETFLRAMGRIIMVFRSQDARIIGDLRSSALGQNLDANLLHKVLQDPTLNEGLTRLSAFLRKQTLIRRYHMKPDKMLQCMNDFGPLDWRHPAAHGVYWGRLGSELADEITGDGTRLDADGHPLPTANQTDVDLVNTFRQATHSLQDLARTGRIVFDPFTRELQMMPDPRFIPAYEKNVEMSEKAYKEQFGVETDSYKGGHENLLLMAVAYLYLYGDIKQAQFYYDRARQLFGKEFYNVQSRRYEQTMEDFVLGSLREDMSMMHQSVQFIDAMIYRAILEGLARGRFETFNRFLTIAHRVYEQYEKDKVANPTAPQNRMSLLPFNKTVMNSYLAFMRNERFDGLTRARVWLNTPLPMQQATYDELEPIVAAQFKAMGLDPQRAFSEPPGMAEYRKARAPADKAPAKPDTGVQVERN
ncbi:MAG: hypothetical protein IT440_05530 [Phycisphaeraceae bacterium]|nr:hypothetical protein [Phycisphaeraceae bacterium]